MENSPKKIVKKLTSRYIKAKPRRISLKLYWNDKRSLINLKGNNLDETAEYFRTINFTSFANGVLDAYRQAYGELKVVPISFREEIYKNDKVSLDIYLLEVREYSIFSLSTSRGDKNEKIGFREQSLGKSRTPQICKRDFEN
jgi:hypothetical protein